RFPPSIAGKHRGSRRSPPARAVRFRPWAEAPSASAGPSGLAKGGAGLFPLPALSERRHPSLARRLVAVRRPTVIKQHRPHPGRPGRGGVGLEEAADHGELSDRTVEGTPARPRTVSGRLISFRAPTEYRRRCSMPPLRHRRHGPKLTAVALDLLAASRDS